MAITQIRGGQVFDNDLTSDDIADAAIRGATSNAGTQREIATGTVSTPDLRDDAVTPAKLDETGNYHVGSLRTEDGTVASPSLRFNSSSGTGLYLISSNTVGVATDGTERLRIDSSGNIGIGGAAVTNGLLTLTSTTKAFVPPRMTTTQRDAIGSPSAGMLVYNTTLSAVNVYNGSSWDNLYVAETDPLSIHKDGSTSPTANIDWNYFQILNQVIHKGASLPGSPIEGQIFYNTTTKQFYGRTDASWILLG